MNHDAWRSLRRNRPALVALAFLLLVTLAAIGADVIAPYSPTAIAPVQALQGPSPSHWLGTDHFGRDTLTRIMYGGRTSLQIAAAAVLIAASVGVFLGLVAGYYRGRVDDVIMRTVDIILAFPGILLALVIVTVLTPGVPSLVLAVGVAGIPHFARVARGSTLVVMANQYVEAARVGGCSDSRIIRRHILPNIMAPIIVLLTIAAGTSLLTAAALSFLGLGPQPPTPEWGAMLTIGRDYLRVAPWLMVFPGLVISGTVLAVNLLGDGLRDALDPRMKVS